MCNVLKQENYYAVSNADIRISLSVIFDHSVNILCWYEMLGIL